MPATIAQEALRFRQELNLGVFPVNPVTKIPRFAKWQRGGLRASSSIEQVFDRMPDTAIGVPGGQMLPYAEGDIGEWQGVPDVQLARFLVKLDVDERNYGIEALSELPKLPRTATAKTPDGWHFWFWSRQPVPAFTRPDGLEIKGLGSYVIAPPAPERTWTRNPFDFEIAEAPDFLTGRPDSAALLLQKNPRTLEWSLRSGNPLELVSRAKPGSRRPTLLSQAGWVNHHLVWKGLLDEQAARQQLQAAALENGTEPKEIERLLRYVFDSPPFQTASARPTGGLLLTVVVTLSGRERAVLRAVCSAYESELSQGVPLPEIKRKLTALSWLAERAELTEKKQVSRCLEKLESLGLVWFAGKAFLHGQTPGKTRPAHFWRPTFAGLAASSMEEA
jgi:hypothetical protein